MSIFLQENKDKKHYVLIVFFALFLINFFNLLYPHSSAAERFSFQETKQIQHALDNHYLELYQTNTRVLRSARLQDEESEDGDLGVDLQVHQGFAASFKHRVNINLVFDHFHVDKFQIIDFYLRAPPADLVTSFIN